MTSEASIRRRLIWRQSWTHLCMGSVRKEERADWEYQWRVKLRRSGHLNFDACSQTPVDLTFRASGFSPITNGAVVSFGRFTSRRTESPTVASVLGMLLQQLVTVVKQELMPVVKTNPG